MTMQKWLSAAQNDRTAEEVLIYWHNLMEGSVRTERERFFREVVNLADAVSHRRLQFTLKLKTRQKLPPLMIEEEKQVSSPFRRTDLEPSKPEFDIHKYSDTFYHHYAKTATERLAAFTSKMTPRLPIVVTYFDEAHVLDESLWSMLRLLSKQAVKTSMWYAFLDTKSTISYFNPAPANSECRDLTFSTVSYRI
jgi:hypothetical protein